MRTLYKDIIKDIYKINITHYKYKKYVKKWIINIKTHIQYFLMVKP